MSAKYSVVVLLVLSSACARASSAPEPVPEAAPGVISPPAPTAGAGRSWKIVPALQPRRYKSTANISLELNTPSGMIRDTLTQRTQFTLLTRSGSGSTTFLGSIESMSTTAGNRTGPIDLPPSLPLSFTGHIANSTTVLDALNGQTQKASPDCTNPAVSALKVIHRNVTVLPADLFQEMTWTDSTSTTVCNGMIPLSSTTIRTYHVVGEMEINNQPAILLERTERTFSTGEGSENQHRILIKTQGAGSGRVYVDRVTGALLASEGEQRAEITITAGRAQRFVQIVRERITLAN